MCRSGVINLQLAVCTEEFGVRHIYEVIYLLIEARILLLFVRLAKISRVFNSLVTGQTVTDSAHFSAGSVGTSKLITLLYLLIEARQQKHYCCCFCGSQKCLESSTAALLRRQPPTKPIFPLAAWGDHSPRWWCGAHPRRALSRSGGVASVSISSVFHNKLFVRGTRDSSNTIRRPTRKTLVLTTL